MSIPTIKNIHIHVNLNTNIKHDPTNISTDINLNAFTRTGTSTHSNTTGKTDNLVLLIRTLTSIVALILL